MDQILLFSSVLAKAATTFGAKEVPACKEGMELLVSRYPPHFGHDEGVPTFFWYVMSKNEQFAFSRTPRNNWIHLARNGLMGPILGANSSCTQIKIPFVGPLI